MSVVKMGKLRLWALQHAKMRLGEGTYGSVSLDTLLVTGVCISSHPRHGPSTFFNLFSALWEYPPSFVPRTVPCGITRHMIALVLGRAY